MPVNQMKCTLCRSGRIQPYFETKDYLTGRSGTWRYDKCSDCGYVFLNPLPTNAELEDFYNSNENKVHYHVAAEISQKQSKFGQIKKWIKKQVLINHLKVRGLGKTSLLGYIVSFPIARTQKVNLFPVDIDMNDRILEIGSSTGQRIALLKSFGFNNLHANEFNMELSKEISRKFNVESSYVDIRDNSNLSPNSFSFIVASMVLEHVLDPISFINRVYDLLKPGAYFSFSVPNIECLEFKLFGHRLYNLHAPYHLSQFNEDSIRKLLKQFDNIKFHYQEFDRDWVVSARRSYQDNPTIKNKILNLSANNFLRNTMLKLFFRFYRVFGKTSRVTVYARKPLSLQIKKGVSTKRLNEAELQI